MHVEDDVEVEIDAGQSDDLAEALEAVTRQGLRKVSQVLRAPLDVTDASLTRNQVTAAGIAINAQLRADEQRLKAKAPSDVLERLLKLIAEEKKKLAARGEEDEEGAFSLRDLRPSGDASKD